MTKSDRVIPVREIEKYLPHRPPMVWIDEVTSFSEKAGACRIYVKGDAHYMDQDGLRSTSCLEFIAQAYGFISVCHHIYVLDPNSKPLSKAFLASMKGAKLPDVKTLASIRDGTELAVIIDGVRQMGPIVMFNGRIMKGDAVICEASMKVFKEYQQ